MVGTAIIVLAATSIICDPSAKRHGEEPNMMADLITLQASIAMTLYFKFNSMLNKEISMN